jgi:glycosyltransferase involved in cell wall biosynthesis
VVARRAIIATRVFEPEGSAAAFRLAALASALRDSGYQTTVLTTRSKEARRSTDEVRRWPVLRDRNGAVRGYLQYASFDVPLFFRLLFARRADFVVVEPPPTTGIAVRLASRIRRMPYVYFAGDVSSVAARGMGVNRMVLRVLTIIEAWALRGARGVLAVSEGVRHQVIELGAQDARVVVVGTGVDTDQFSRVGSAEDPGYPYFVYAGTMSELQGADVFIEAFGEIRKDFPTLRLKMFGSGVEVDKLVERARHIGDGRIEFPGSVSGPELAPWLRGAQAGLASSRPGLGYEFAFATKALASLSCGTSVIYAGEGPIRLVVTENDAGWAVDWDAHAVARAMRSSLARPRDSSRSARLAKLVLESYSLRAVGRKGVHAIERLLGPDEADTGPRDTALS